MLIAMCQVRLMGKPDPIVYISAMKLIGLESSEVLAVGDSLEHDISGGFFVNFADAYSSGFRFAFKGRE